MTKSTINHLQEEFIREAKSAPKLFKDLAKVEQYVAESYKTRALIELIQNADDANSLVFGIHKIDRGFAVGNDGREFTPEDIEALCRSGSSNKHRGGSTIGYRGIGFKSVVNLTRKIYVFSGDFAFYFDKSRTQSVLQSNHDVPLIRIPHPLEKADQILAQEVLELANKNSYRTIFVFQEGLSGLRTDELAEFDNSSLIFLNNLRSLRIDWPNLKREVSLQSLKSQNKSIVRIIESDSSDDWEIEHSFNNKINRVAYKKNDDFIVPAGVSNG